MAKKEEEEEDNKHLRWQLSPLPSLPPPCLLIDLFLRREILMLAIDELRIPWNLIPLV